MPKNNILQEKFNGDREAYREYMRSLASKGGKVKVSKGRYGGKNKK